MPTPYERFLERLWADVDAGQLRPVEAYLAEFPGLEEQIRREHAALQNEQAAPCAPDPPERPQSTATDELLKKLANSPRLDEKRFVIEQEIGRGGFGAVFRVVDQHLGRRLAMKVAIEREPPRTDAAQRLLRQLLGRFLDEAQITSQLDHPGVVPVHELGLDTTGRVYFTMRLVRGRTLDHVFADAHAERDGWYTTRALEVLLKVCDTMAYAHSKGVLHRDLKPTNVMVGRYGELYVMDWGLAKVVDQPDKHDLRIAPETNTALSEAHSLRDDASAGEPGSSVLTMDGQRLGTPSYMSVEQARGEGVDFRTDVASIGAMLYELLTGRAPYTTPGVRKKAYQILEELLEGPPKPVHGLARGVPAELVAICEKAMARDLAHRYASLAELAADLRAYLDQRVVTAYRTGAIAEMRMWVRRNKPLAASLAAAVLFLVAGIFGTSYMTLRARQLKEIADDRATRMAALAQEKMGLADREKQAREESESRRVEAQANLNRFNLLADVVNLRELKAAEALLYPAFPEQVPAMERWLAEARALAGRLPTVRAARDEVLARSLARLPAASRPTSGTASASQPTASQVAERLPRGDPDRFLLETLDKLTSDLDAFERSEVPSVERRLNEAKQIHKLSIEDHRAEWDAAIEAIAREPKYGGLRIQPQVGLVPIGADAASGLWEFAHLPSGQPAKRHPPLKKLVIGDATGIVFVLLPAGKFWMGAQKTDPQGQNYGRGAEGDESPVRQVALGAFFMSKHEMTRGQWAKLSGGQDPSANRVGAGFPGDSLLSASHPVEYVSWEMCEAMVSRNGLELPTEAQWEYGCRAGTATVWGPGDRATDLEGFGNVLDRKAVENYPAWGRAEEFSDGFTGPAPVGSFKPNAFGWYDMHGNCWEWCRDLYGGYGGVRDPRDGLSLEADGSGLRVGRGGSFGIPAANARSARRFRYAEEFRGSDLGLRPARIVTE